MLFCHKFSFGTIYVFLWADFLFSSNLGCVKIFNFLHVGTAPAYTAPDYTAPKFTALNYNALHCNAPNYLSLKYTTPDDPAPEYTSLKFTETQFTVLQYTSTDCNASDYTTTE